MSKELMEEVSVPVCAAHFTCNGLVEGVSRQGVTGEPADDGKVLRRVVLAGASGVSWKTTSRLQCNWFLIAQWARTVITSFCGDSALDKAM